MTRTQNLRKGDIVNFDFGYKVAAGLVLEVTGRTVTVDTYQGSFTVPADSDQLRPAR